MPELPEVEVVRRGLVSWVRGRTITSVDVLDPRSIRRHALGTEDFVGNLEGATVADVVRRGKFLWMPLLDDAPADAPPAVALMAHLGMSGQLLMQDSSAPDEKHLKVRFRLSPRAGMPEQLRFVDQRIFGGLFVTAMVPTDDGGPGGLAESPLPLIADEASHIARDPLDPEFDDAAFVRKVRRSTSGIKRILLNQTVISGVGNIYADEALWLARLHGERRGDRLRVRDVEAVLAAARTVMLAALGQGGTSFDALYVNVNGESGYFDRSLEVYGQQGEPCSRCGTPIVRTSFMNRSSFFCPACQPPPRGRA